MDINTKNIQGSSIKKQIFPVLTWLVILLFCVMGIQDFSQEMDLKKQNDTTRTRTVTIVLDEPADSVRVFIKHNRQYQELIGNVRFRHVITVMRMDSTIIDVNNHVEDY